MIAKETNSESLLPRHERIQNGRGPKNSQVIDIAKSNQKTKLSPARSSRSVITNPLNLVQLLSVYNTIWVDILAKLVQ